MAEPATRNSAGGTTGVSGRWPYEGRGRPASPQSVGGPLAPPDTSGGSGGSSLLSGLKGLFDLGMSVYDRFWGKDAAENDLRRASQLSLIQQRYGAQAEKIHKEQQGQYQQALETSSGNKFTPELEQLYPEAQDVYMNRPGIRALPATQGVPGTEATTSPAGAGAGLGNLVVSPYRVIQDEAPGALQQGRQRLDKASSEAIGALPAGPARETMTKFAQVRPILPSDAPKVHKEISEAGTAAGTAALKNRELWEAQGTDQAMARYRGQVPGHPAGMLEDLHEALGYSQAGRGQLATLTQQQRAHLTTHGSKIAEQREVHKKNLEGGDPNNIRQSATLLNQMEWGFATAGGLPTVTIHPTIKTDRMIFNPTYSTVPIEVPVAAAQRWLFGQMNPRDPRALAENPRQAATDLFWLSGLEHGILPSGGQFTPDQAKVMKDYIARYPGVPQEVRDWASFSVDEKTVQAGPGQPGAEGPPAPRGLQPVPGYTPPPPPVEKPMLQAPPGAPPEALSSSGVPVSRFTPPPQPSGPVRTPVPGGRRGAQLAAPPVAAPPPVAPAPPAQVAPQAPAAPSGGQRFPEPPMPPIPLPIRGQAPPPAQAPPPTSGGWRLRAPPVTPPAYGQPGVPRSMFQRQPGAVGGQVGSAIPPVAAPQIPTIQSPNSGPNTAMQAVRVLSPLPQQEQLAIIQKAQEFGIDPGMLAALRRAENGPPGMEFGVMSEPAPTYEDQIRIAAASIRNSLARYRALPGNPDPIGADGRYTDDWIKFFSARYAPVKGATNDPRRKNVNHAPNLINIYGQGRRV